METVGLQHLTTASYEADNHTNNVTTTSRMAVARMGEDFSQTEHNVIGVLYLVAALGGCVGNIYLLVQFIKQRLLPFPRNLTHINFLLANLGVILGFPLTAPSSFAGRWLPGHIGCQAYGFAGMFFGLTAITVLTIMAVERAIVADPNLSAKLQVHHYVIGLVGAWLASALWASMPLFGWSRYAIEPTGSSCTLDWRNPNAAYSSYTWALTVFCYGVPFTVMAGALWKAWGQGGRGGVEVTGTNSALYTERGLIKMNFFMAVTCLVQWTPYAIVCMWALFGDPYAASRWTAVIPPLQCKLVSCIHPLIYIVHRSKNNVQDKNS